MLERILDSIARKPSIGVVGISSWDTILSIDEYPVAGGYALVANALELPGGTSANAAVAAARLGASVELTSTVGNDEAGRQLVESIAAAGVDVKRVRIDRENPTDRTTVISSTIPANRTILWRQGAYPRKGDRLDIDRLFTRDLVLLDSVDPELRRFLIDLPVHTYPGVKILLPLTYAVDFPGRDEFGSIVRCDAVVGSELELQALTGCDSLAAGVAKLQSSMQVSNLRWAAVTRGANGAIAFDAATRFEVEALPVDVVDSTGAGDAFAGAFAVGLASRLELREALLFANVTAALSTTGLGAQTALPSISQVAAILRSALRP